MGDIAGWNPLTHLGAGPAGVSHEGNGGHRGLEPTNSSACAPSRGVPRRKWGTSRAGTHQLICVRPQQGCPAKEMGDIAGWNPLTHLRAAQHGCPAKEMGDIAGWNPLTHLRAGPAGVSPFPFLGFHLPRFPLPSSTALSPPLRPNRAPANLDTTETHFQSDSQ